MYIFALSRRRFTAYSWRIRFSPVGGAIGLFLYLNGWGNKRRTGGTPQPEKIKTPLQPRQTIYNVYTVYNVYIVYTVYTFYTVYIVFYYLITIFALT